MEDTEKTTQRNTYIFFGILAATALWYFMAKEK